MPMTNTMPKYLWNRAKRVLVAGLAAGLGLLALPAQAQETVCARVKIEIKQELTLERQAFDAEMKINNTTDAGVIENVGVVVKVTEEDGTPVAITSDPNDLSAKFFIRISKKENISDVDGAGVVGARTTAVINWLLIPAPGSAGENPAGKKYLVGARLNYRFGGEDTVLDVSPDVITVKPLPLLTLDYFLPEDVFADDPLTAPVEPVEPFTLGVRVQNSGQAAASNVKIDSAQPKIVENNQGLLINFLLTGSYVDDAPAQNTLLINFGNIAPNTSKMGRWNMETTLSGKFVEFTAKFTHADELGGALTSILKATNAHFLIRDVRVDLPGRDLVRDFLAKDGDVIRLYESDGPDTLVTDQTALASLTATAGSGNTANYRLSLPPTAGFAFVRLRDPFNGTKALGRVVRSDAKELLSDNVWLSKTRNKDTKQIEYWFNLLDVNSTGEYNTEFAVPAVVALPPVVQFIPNRVTRELKQVAFMVEASSPQGKPVTLSAAPLPAGATFTMQAADPDSPTVARAIFDWTPPTGSAGNYLINFTASDGSLSAARSASIRVDAQAPADGPAVPVLDMPLAGAQVTSLKPVLSVFTSSQPDDTTTQVQFEVFSDETETQKVADTTVWRAPLDPGNGAGPVVAPTQWQVPNDLDDNTTYWWRARSFDGTVYSAWVKGDFFVNTYNDPPDAFNLSLPVPGAQTDSLTPTLSWTNSRDKDGDEVSYGVQVFADAGLSAPLAQAQDLPASAGGTTTWTVSPALTDLSTYYWRVTATDALGAQTLSAARPFTVQLANSAPSQPVASSPVAGALSGMASTVLTVQNSTDAEGDLISYVFEVDTVNTFDSADKRSSGPVIQASGGQTSWATPELVEDQHYWWRVKAQDGKADSAWSVSDFLMSARNDPPSLPGIDNPGSGAWVSTLQPTLHAHPSVDPEGGAFHYEFQVFGTANLNNLLAQGQSEQTGWMVPVALPDGTNVFWRVRSVDALGSASAWTTVRKLTLNAGAAVPPTIKLRSPTVVRRPVVVNSPQGSQYSFEIKWKSDVVSEQGTVALYYGSEQSGYAGTLIADGLRSAAGTTDGSYLWNMTGLPEGVYYIYGVVSNGVTSGQAYAAGALLIPAKPQEGYLVQKTPGVVRTTTETGRSAQMTMRLGRRPTHDVIVPLSSNKPSEGVVHPASLTFTRDNWNVNQSATVTGTNDCVPQMDTTFDIVVGQAQSLDPNYNGIAGTPHQFLNRDGIAPQSSTNNANIFMCGMTVVSERQVNSTRWEYVLRASVSNTGADVKGLTARLVKVPGPAVMEADLVFGAVNLGESGVTEDTVTLRAARKIAPAEFQKARGYRWDILITP